MKPALEKVLAGEDLTRDEAYAAMDSIMSGKASDVQIAGLLVALRGKGESAQEIAGFALAMRDHMLKVTLDVDAIDMCGTGGDAKGTFNISTAAAFVVAGAGVPVAKHGNRAISSASGSADVLSALGIDTGGSADDVSRSIETAGLGFMFAPNFHPAMKHVMPARTGLAIRTVFNILGPLCNPAGVKRQVIGLFDGSLAPTLANVLRQLGSENVLLVHGEDGMDELTTTARTTGAHLTDGAIAAFDLHPDDVGLQLASPGDLKGGGPDENARMITAILRKEPGAPRDIVVLNAAAGLLVAGKTGSLSEGRALAEQSIDSGRAEAVLKAMMAR